MTNTVNDYSALSSPASDDYLLIWDTSAGATKKIAYGSFGVNLGTLITGYTALVTPASDDLLAIYDTSAATMKKIAVSAFDYDLGAEIAAATGIGTPASGDLFAIYDISTSTLKSVPYSTLAPGYIKADGTVALTGDWDIGSSRRIAGEKLRARSAAGLRLEEDAGGLGIYIEDSTGNVGIGTATLTGAPRLTVNGAVRAGYDTATTSYFGRAAVGYDGTNSDSASFAHVDRNTYQQYALTQTAAGITIVNAPAGQTVQFAINALSYAIMSDTALYSSVDGGLDLGSSSNKFKNIYTSSFVRGAYDTDTTSYFGRAAIGYDGSSGNVATFSHLDHVVAASIALRQNSSGETRINSAYGQQLLFSIDSIPYFCVDSTGAFYPNSDNAYDLGKLAARYDDVYATNGTIQTSDVRLKDDVSESDLGLAFIRALAPLRYKFAGKTRPHYGLASQQVRRVLDELGIPDFAGYIHDRETDAYGLRYTEFIAPMIAAIQEIADRLDRIEAA